MTSRELVLKTLNGANNGRAPRHLATLPWAEIYHGNEVAAIRREFPDDITGVAGVFAQAPKVIGEPYEIGEYIDEFGCMAGRQWLHITPEGDILPCSCVPIPYGNVKTGKSAMKDAWKKIRAEPAYNKSAGCLMRDSEFREIYGDQFQ